MCIRIILLCTILLNITGVQLVAQTGHVYSLKEVVENAQRRSYSAQLSATKREVSHYQYITYQSDSKPQISFSGTAPFYNKQFFGVRQPDGTIYYQSINQHTASIGVALSQKLPFSGGTLSLNTDLTRFDDFNVKTKQYSGTPIFLRLSQPLFAVNDLKWNRKIEPLKYEESRKQFYLEMENIAQVVSNLYFNVLEAQNNIEIAQGNLLVCESNFEIEKKRVNLGTTTEDRLLQLELLTLKSKQDMEKSRYEYVIAQLNLKSFLGKIEEDEMHLMEPGHVPSLTIDLIATFRYAKMNRPEFIAFQRKTTEAHRDVIAAKAAKQEVNLTASYGLNNVGNQITDVYTNPREQQVFSIGFSVPIIDWGRRKARYNTAKALEKLIETTNEFDEAKIFQEITTLVKSIELLESNITLAKTTDSVAQKRYSLANSLFQIGKLTVTDLNLAQSEKDRSRRSVINALRAYWESYYMLRKLTLYDFETQTSLISERKESI